MKKAGVMAVLILILSGCSSSDRALERGLSLRSSLQKASVCTFDADITADYGDKLYEFSMTCTCDGKGNLTFTVTEPQSIRGITGKIDAQGGALTFDGHALHFPLLADGQAVPAAAPWILMKALLGGSLKSAGMQDGRVLLTVNDSFEDDALTADICLNAEDLPQTGEIFWADRRVLSVLFKNFAVS